MQSCREHTDPAHDHRPNTRHNPRQILFTGTQPGRRGPAVAALSLDLDNRTAGKSCSNAETLLEELATDRGLRWRDISRLCGVPVSAIRRWRAGESIATEHQHGLARLAAFLELVEEVKPIDEPSGWLLMRLSEQHTVRAADLYIEGRINDLIEYTQGHIDVDVLLDRLDPNWRTVTRSEWKVIVSPDGERYLAQRD